MFRISWLSMSHCDRGTSEDLKENGTVVSGPSQEVSRSNLKESTVRSDYIVGDWVSPDRLRSRHNCEDYSFPSDILGHRASSLLFLSSLHRQSGRTWGHFSCTEQVLTTGTMNVVLLSAVFSFWCFILL